MADNTDYVALSKHIQAKGYKRNANNREIEKAKKEMAKKMDKPRLHYGSVNFTASNPSYKKAKK